MAQLKLSFDRISWAVTLLYCGFVEVVLSDNGMFRNVSSEWLQDVPTTQRNYGVAVSDVDGDGTFEVIVAGYTGGNIVLKYDPGAAKLVNIAQPGTPFGPLADPEGQTLGVAACDIDGDGREEIYVLNSGKYSGVVDYGDKLFKWRDGNYVNLYSDDVNSEMRANFYAGRSVACLDRFGNGEYGFIVATYAKEDTDRFALIEMDKFDPQNDIATGNIVLHNVAEEAGIDGSTGGRGVVVGPIFGNEGKSDIYFVNERNSWDNPGSNYLFKNLGDGTFEDLAQEYGLDDPSENGRGVTLTDLDHNGLLDIVYGNWNGPHRIYLQNLPLNFNDIANASPEFVEESPIRTVIAADFDNDQNTEIFMNNIVYNGPQPNRLFTVIPQQNDDPLVMPIPIGDALEAGGYGTGAAVSDIDGDGILELVTSHGESQAQPIKVYKVTQGTSNGKIRFLIKTQNGAPARGATVTLHTSSGLQMMQVIDGGSGYLCQMEPVAHFGLGSSDEALSYRVQWPDGTVVEKDVPENFEEELLTVAHPDATQVVVQAQITATITK